MNYEDSPPSPALEGWIKAFWRLDAGEDRGVWLENDATPDGSIEIIRRKRGASLWRRSQPTAFAAGLTTSPALLKMRGDAVFCAVRLWPWTWRLLGGPPCSGFTNDWVTLPHGSRTRAIADRLDDASEVERLILDAAAEAPHGVAVRAVGQAILQSSSVADVVERTGLSHRSLQRWTAAYIGMPLRTYLRLLRFQSALSDIQASRDTLAQSAVDNGYADQAHMARSFRELAGMPPVVTRSKALGPFIQDNSGRRAGEWN